MIETIKELKRKLNKKEVWQAKLSGLYVEISHWGVERHNGFKPLNDGQGVWNYYITIPERLVSEELFSSLWLPSSRVKFSPTSPERLTENYMSQPFSANIDWHGGCTYYEKQGQEIGHRYVKLGCDYSHICDAERGYDYELEEVLLDAAKTAEELAIMFKITTNI